MRRVALVETVPEERHRHHGAEWFPYVLGWLREAGAAAEWWAFGVPHDPARAEARFVADLSPGARRALAEHVARFAPDTLLFQSRPAPGLVATLAASAPAVRIVDATRRAPLAAGATVADVGRLLGVPGPPPGDPAALLLDAIAPRFERRLLDGAAICAAQAARLAVEVSCLYRRRVRDAAPYADLEAAGEHRGCAFCDRGAPPEPRAARPRTPPREVVLRQIEAHQRDRAREGSAFAYLLDDGRLAADLPGLLEAAMERGIRPATFHAMPRVDELLAQGDRLRRVLPRAAEAGHRVGILSTGIENFSPEENARLHKGIDPEQVWACRALIEELEAAFPGTFFAEPGLFAGILFTPWTRPADLRANLEAARRLGAGWLERVMGTRLQLFPGVPITALARRDGLVVEGRGSAAEVTALCLSHPDATEAPWRFADARTALAHAILVRLDPIPFSARVADDPLTAELRELRARLPPPLADDYVELCAAIVDAVEALGAGTSPGDVLRAVAASPAARAAAARATPAPSRARAERPGAAGEDALRVTFADRATGAPRYVFRVARASPGAPAFRVVGGTRVTYDRCARDAAFEPCASVVLAAASRFGAPPGRADADRWERLLRALASRAGLARRFEVCCAPDPGR